MHTKSLLALLMLSTTACAQPQEAIDAAFDSSAPALLDQAKPEELKQISETAEQEQATGTALPGEPASPEGEALPPPEEDFFGDRDSVSLDGQTIKLRSPKALHAFYNTAKAYNHWNAERAARLAEVVASARNDGLPPAKYHPEVIAAFQDDEAHQILLSDAFLSLAGDLANGLVNPRITQPEWNGAKVSDEELAELLASALEKNDFATPLEALNRDNPRYQALRRAYNAQINGEDTPPEEQLTSAGMLQLNSDHPDVLILRKKLGLAGDSTLYDESVRDAVLEYQKKHRKELGKPDGRVGKKTRDKLNGKLAKKPAKISLDLLQINMERQRWMPQELGNTNIIVNIPSYTAKMFRDGAEIYSTRTVIGRRDRQTPAFVDRLRHVVMSPMWTVPPTILKDKIEKGQVTSAYDLVTNRGKYVSPANGSVPAGHTLRMKSSPSNPLGKVKFLFPNSHAIYLHDTPRSGAFFGQARSSGCIRLQDPENLAYLLLTGVKSKEQIKNDMGYRPKEVWSNPLEPVPIYLVYWTVSSDLNGKIATASDVYGKDAKLIAQYKKALEIKD